MAKAEFASRSHGEIFVSDVIVGDGTAQSTPHGLVDLSGVGVVPSIVFAFITQKDITTAFAFIEGVHDAINVIFTVEATASYRVVAIR